MTNTQKFLESVRAEAERLKNSVDYYEPSSPETPMTSEEESKFQAHLQAILDEPEMKAGIEKVVDHLKWKAEREKLANDYPKLKSEADRLALSVESYKAILAKCIEAMNMGAFHHSICSANFYDDDTIRPDWKGIGEHRATKPCTCAHWKIDLALAEARAVLVGKK